PMARNAKRVGRYLLCNIHPQPQGAADPMDAADRTGSKTEASRISRIRARRPAARGDAGVSDTPDSLESSRPRATAKPSLCAEQRFPLAHPRPEFSYYGVDRRGPG